MFNQISINESIVNNEVTEVLKYEFLKLPLPEQCIVYAKIKHGDLFEQVSNDLYDIGKKEADEIYKAFLSNVRMSLNVTTTESN